MLISVLSIVQADIGRLMKQLRLEVSHLKFFRYGLILNLVFKIIVTDLDPIYIFLSLPAF